MPPTTIPTPDELRSLIRAAIAFRDAAPWDRRDPAEILAIENPETGTVGFLLSWAGGPIGHPGAQIALDAETIDLMHGMQHAPTGTMANLGMRRNVVTLLLTPAEEVDPSDLELYVAAGIDVPGELVPVFHRFEPRRMPRELDAPAARFATVALEQALRGLTRFDPATGTIAVRVLRDGEWREEARSAEEVFRVERPAPPEILPQWYGMVRRVKRREDVWELGAMLLPVPLADGIDDELACAHMVADADGVFLDATSRQRDPEGLCALLVEAIELRRARPRMLLVSDPAIEHALTNLAAALDIEVQVSANPPVIGAGYGMLMREFQKQAYEEAGVEPPAIGMHELEMPAGFRYRTVVIDYDGDRSGWDRDLEPGDALRIEKASQMSMSQPRKAEKQLRALIEEFPGLIVLRSELAQACLAAGSTSRARQAIDAALRELPPSLELRILDAQIRLSTDGPDAADAALGGDELYDIVDEGSAVGIVDAGAFHLVRSLIALQRGEAIVARRHLAVVESLRPDDPQLESLVATIDALGFDEIAGDREPVTLPAPEQILRLRIELDHIRPKIWRDVEVASNWTFDVLHEVIQGAMGWYDTHLHEFTSGGSTITMEYDDAPPDGEPEAETRLDAYLSKVKAKVKYVYDFGDDWGHTITVRAIVPPEPGVRYPRVLDGARACPPEDCGGPWGYERMLGVLADAKHDEHEEMLEWLGGGYDPEDFDVTEANDALDWLRG